MSIKPSARLTIPSRTTFHIIAAVITAVATPSWAETALEKTAVKIDRVAPHYTPTTGSQAPEPVSMQRHAFEVEPETGRARVVVDYTYPNQATFGLDGGAGPRPTTAQFPGLSYDSASKTVVYDSEGKKTVCATVSERKLAFWRSLAVTPTGSCTVTSQLNIQAEDTGWNVRRQLGIDVFFLAH